MTWTAKRIRELRDKYDERQIDFCKRLRVSVDALRFWEQGRGEPGGPVEELLDRLAEELLEGRIRPLPDYSDYVKTEKQPAVPA